MTSPLMNEIKLASALRGEALLWGTHDAFLIMDEPGPLIGMRKLVDESMNRSIDNVDGIERLATGDLDIELFMARMTEQRTRETADNVFQMTSERMIVVACYRYGKKHPDAEDYLSNSYKTNFVLHEKYDRIIKERRHDHLAGYMMSIRFRLLKFAMNSSFIGRYADVSKFM